jgi:hypothetical protein
METVSDVQEPLRRPTRRGRATRGDESGTGSSYSPLCPGVQDTDAACDPARAHIAIGSSTTGFVSLPIFSISIVTVSPAFNHSGGLRAAPTP